MHILPQICLHTFKFLMCCKYRCVLLIINGVTIGHFCYFIARYFIITLLVSIVEGNNCDTILIDLKHIRLHIPITTEAIREGFI